MKSILLLSTLLITNFAFADIAWTKYSDKALEEAKSNGDKVVLGFHKKGCGTCHAQDLELERTGINKVEGITFLKVERKNSSHNNVYTKYGFSKRQWAALVLLKDGNEVTRVNPGVTSSSDIRNFAKLAK